VTQKGLARIILNPRRRRLGCEEAPNRNKRGRKRRAYVNRSHKSSIRTEVLLAERFKTNVELKIWKKSRNLAKAVKIKQRKPKPQIRDQSNEIQKETHSLNAKHIRGQKSLFGRGRGTSRDQKQEENATSWIVGT